MDMDFEGTWQTKDSVDPDVQVAVEDTDIVVDSDTDWDTVPTVDSQSITESHRLFFNADSFYRFDVTVARSIPQNYVINDKEYTFLKRPEDLQKASWSLENTSYVLEHPSRGMVTDASQIRGFYNAPYFDASDESLNAKLTVPQNDTEALDYLKRSSDVSVGFFNTLDTDATEDGIDAYQRDMYIDHVASVQTGRCSSEDGCKVHFEQ